jgi:hypothetical protein
MDFIKNYMIKLVTSIVIICAYVILSLQFPTGGNDWHWDITKQGELFGVALTRSLLAFLAGLILIRLPRTKLDGWLLCFAIALSFGVYTQSEKERKSAQFDKAKIEMARIADSLEKGTLQNNPKSYSVKEYGDFSKILPFFEKSQVCSEKLVNDMNKSGAILEKLPTYIELGDSEKYTKAKDTIEEFRSLIKNCEKNYYEYISSIEKFVRETNFEDNINRTYTLKGLNSGKKRTDEVMKEYFSLYNELANVIHEQIDFFSKKIDFIHLSNDVLTFENAEDEETYFQLDQKVVMIIHEEKFINKKLFELRQENLNALKNMDKWE